MNCKAIRTVLTFATLIIFVVTGVAAYSQSYGNNLSGSESENPENTGYLSGIFFNPPDITAPSAILIESKRGQILYQKNAGQKLHISAANKIMTAILSIEKIPDLNAKVTISKESAEAEGSALSLEIGEKYAVEDLLYAITLTSANDAARALAEYAAGDIKKFESLMNEKAHELNLKDTHFTNSTGLYDENQHTTAYDISLLVKYAINNPAYNRIFSSRAKPWTDADGQTKILANQNELFWSYDGVDGGKIGYNEKDKQSVITTATRGSRRLICVVLDAPSKAVYEDSIKLLDFGFNSFRTGILVPKGYPQKTIQIEGREVNLVSLSDVYYTYPIGRNYIKSLEFDIAKNLSLPITKNKVMGTARYLLEDNTAIAVDLYPDIEIKAPEDFYSVIKKKIADNKDIFYLLGFLLAIEAVLILYNLIKLIVRMIFKVFSNKAHGG